MKPGYESDFCKHTYVGAPVKSIAHPCPVCKEKAGECKCKDGACHMPTPGLCQAVIDDANNLVYLYGNVVHENYHVPGNDCVAYVAVNSGDANKKIIFTEELYGSLDLDVTDPDNPKLTLQHTPAKNGVFLIFSPNSNDPLSLPSYHVDPRKYTVDGNVVTFHEQFFTHVSAIAVAYQYGEE